MLWEFFRFELRFRFRQPAVYLFSAIFALLAFGAVTTDAVVIGGGAGRTAINAPYVTTQMLAVMSVVAVLVVTAFVATAVIREYELGTHGLLFTKPIGKASLVVGRFLGACAVASVVMIACALGLAIGSTMPWLDPIRVVASGPTPYVHALVVFVLPNLLLTGGIFFAVATLSRRVIYAYVAVVAFFVVYSIAQAYMSDLGNEQLAAVLDPFGLSALQLATRYWTVAERNTQLVPMTGALAINRVLWLAVGLACLVVTVRRFRLAAPLERRRHREGPGAVAEQTRREVAIPSVHARHDLQSTLSQWWHQTRVEVRGIVRSAPFLVLALFAVANVVGNAVGVVEQMYGTTVHPVTHLMVQVVQGGLSLYLLIVITFYAGELVWRERQNRMAEVYDATPVSDWVPLLAKLVALWVAVAALIGVGMLTGIALQIAQGFTRIEVGLYLRGLYGLVFTRSALLCVLAIALQVLANHKYVGFLFMILFWISQIALPALDLQHHLYRFAAAPGAPYSDMNGYGHFSAALVWYRMYWACVALGLVVVSRLLWVRGTDARWRLRLRLARRRVGVLETALAATAAVGTAGVGGWIFYNTTILNRYVPGDELERLQVVYEQRYKQHEDVPQPRIVQTEVEADIFPEERRLEMRGRYRLRNKTEAMIDRLHVRLDPELEVNAFGLGEELLEHEDDEVGYRIYRLDSPLAPDDEIELTFDLTFVEPGFKNHGSVTDIVGNGTFFHNSRYVPHIGYDPDAELSDPNERRDRGLPERPRMAALDDPEARGDTYISREADWIDFGITVSTSADQIALAPGYLKRTWEKDGRRYFRYEMDAPILNLWAVLSARYAVARDQWKDVAIEVYHHPAHDFNVDRMIYAVKRSLDYYTEHFGPYQHRQVRIVEFPRYARFAQSLPNIIPYSESIGFIADLRDEEDIDYVFYVTAHEVAHQWWAHQVIGSNAQGSTMLSETFAQYSALMVMEQEYGRDRMERFLRYELDKYLQGRGVELERELPLIRVENQPYVHYNKGSLVMYVLREYLGEGAVNGVLSDYLEDVGFQDPPYTNSLEFLERLREIVPQDHAYLVEDLFETITLYDNRVVEANAIPLDDGRWKVKLEVGCRKLRADEEGAEQEAPLEDWIEIGVFGGEGSGREPLYLEKHRITEPRTHLELTVDARPNRAGVDPRVLLVDRNPEDNLTDIAVSP